MGMLPGLHNALPEVLATTFAWQVAGLTVGPEYDTHFENLYKVWIGQLGAILPQGTNIPAAYLQGSGDEQDFVQNLALFLTAFFKVPP